MLGAKDYRGVSYNEEKIERKQLRHFGLAEYAVF